MTDKDGQSKEELHTLRTKYVFIDTQLYRKLRFDWNNPQFVSLLERIENGTLKLLITEVIRKEISHGIRDEVEAALSALKKAHRSTSILRHIRADRLEYLAAPDDVATILGEMESNADHFFTAAKAITLELPDHTLGQLFNMYFKGTAPFGDGRKKSEFPDAANVIAIEEWIQKSSTEATEIYLVSEDPDLAKCCDENSKLIHSETLKQVLGAALRSEWGNDHWTNERLHKLLGEKTHIFLDRLKADFPFQEFDVDLGNGHLDNIFVTNVHIADVFAIDRKDEGETSIGFLMQVYVHVEYEAEVSFWDTAQGTEFGFNASGSELLEFEVNSFLHLDDKPQLEIKKMKLVDPGIINIDVTFDF
jgi:hypothetical protein